MKTEAVSNVARYQPAPTPQVKNKEADNQKAEQAQKNAADAQKIEQQKASQSKPTAANEINVTA